MGDPVKDLRDLLTRERFLLTAGQLQDALDLTAQKEALVRSLAASGPDRADVSDIQGMLRRNADLASAARAGLAQAIRRLSDLRDGGAGTTYDDKGRQTPSIPSIRSVERRA